MLDSAMLSRRDDLATEAAKLLIAREGPAPVAARALDAAHEPLRRLAVSWLIDEFDKAPEAKDSLRKALKSRYPEVREAAAFGLAGKKDLAAFDALVGLLKDAPKSDAARPYVRALTSLGDPRTASAFVDRVEDDPAGTAPVEDLLKAAGSSRNPEVFDRLFALLDKPGRRSPALVPALLAISGHDQPIEDFEDERDDRKWEASQFPRQDELLARLLGRLTAPGETGASDLIRPARWSRSGAVDPVLATLIAHPDESTRRAAIEAIGWRARKRKGDFAPLVKALGSKDPVAQLLAAEGLARAGRPEGLSVLLASVEFVTDLNLRRRAVSALGELGDERSADVLVKLAGEDGHALQDEAAEAIGHLGQSKHAEAITRLLERHARGNGSVVQHAIQGLRWLNTASGWGLIRDRAVDPSFFDREIAVEQLAHDRDPATKDLLLRLLAEDDDFSVLEAAVNSARKVFGPDSLEPDEAIVQNENATGSDDFEAAEERVCERSSPARIFAILEKSPPEEVRTSLCRALLNRPSPPLAEAEAGLGSPSPIVAALAASLLGRAGSPKAGASVKKALEARWSAWKARRETSRDEADGGPRAEEALALARLIWASGRLGAALDLLAEIARTPADDRFAATVRKAAVQALAASPNPSKNAIEALESAAEAGNPDLRAEAAQALAENAPKAAAKLAETLLSDRSAFDRLARADGLGAVLRSNAGVAHYQGVVLPYLVEEQDVKTLAAVAEDRSRPEFARLGAIEALAATALGPAEDVLKRIGANSGDDEEIRKAAWRAVRRSRRLRLKANPPKKAEVAR